MQNEDQKLFDLVKSLEIFMGQEIQALQKTVIKRFELSEESIRTNKQGEEIPVPPRVSDDLPRLTKSFCYLLLPLSSQLILNTQMDKKNVNGNL